MTLPAPSPSPSPTPSPFTARANQSPVLCAFEAHLLTTWIAVVHRHLCEESVCFGAHRLRRGQLLWRPLRDHSDGVFSQSCTSSDTSDRTHKRYDTYSCQLGSDIILKGTPADRGEPSGVERQLTRATLVRSRGRHRLRNDSIDAFVRHGHHLAEKRVSCGTQRLHHLLLRWRCLHYRYRSQSDSVFTTTPAVAHAGLQQRQRQTPMYARTTSAASSCRERPPTMVNPAGSRPLSATAATLSHPPAQSSESGGSESSCISESVTLLLQSQRRKTRHPTL